MHCILSLVLDRLILLVCSHWSYWIFTAFVLSFVIMQILSAKTKFEIKLEKLFLTIFVPWMMYASLPISQFPSIFTVNDAVGHLANAENVILNGGVHYPASGLSSVSGHFLYGGYYWKYVGVTGGNVTS